MYKKQIVLATILLTLAFSCNTVSAAQKYYTVKKGDTFSSICEKIFGNGTEKFWKDAAEKIGINPEKIRAGQKIQLPPYKITSNPLIKKNLKYIEWTMTFEEARVSREICNSKFPSVLSCDINIE